MLFQDQTTVNPADQTQTQEDWLAKIVEAKGENFKDPQVLAKSKLEADAYIKTLEQQAKELREELERQDYAKKVLEQLENKGATSSTANSPAPKDTGTNTSDTKPDMSEDVVKTLVAQVLTEREAQNTAAQNSAFVQKELTAKYGTEAPTVLSTKAQELGMDLGTLSAIAEKSPTAFFKLIGEPNKPFTPITQGTINTAATNLQAPTERNWDFYQDLRRKNRTLYYSPKIQQQLMQDKARLGEKFGN